MRELLDQIDEHKRRIDSYRPFDPPMLHQVREYYRSRLVYTSNAIEGFSYTEQETALLLEYGLTAGGKPLRDALAVVGHGKAYDRMFSLLKGEGLEEKDLLAFHALLEGSLANEAVPGEYRRVPVRVGGSPTRFPGWETVPERTSVVFGMLPEKTAQLHPVLAAAWLHRNIVMIHPFADGNGRVARLAMNALLIQSGHLPAIINPDSRMEYIRSLQAALTDNAPSYRVIAKCELRSQQEMLLIMTPDDENPDAYQDVLGATGLGRTASGDPDVGPGPGRVRARRPKAGLIR
jgi:Fic family protein